MNKKFALILCFMVLGLKEAHAHTNWELWDTDSVETHLKGPLYVGLEQEFHWGNDISRFSYEHTDLEFIDKQWSWLHPALGYEFVYQKNNDDWEKESRPHADLTLLGQWSGMKLSNRNRFEYRVLSNTKDSVRYRNKTELRFPWHLTFFKISPVLSYEYFSDFDQNSNNYYRLSGGLEFSLTDRLKAELYYLRQDGYDRNYSYDLKVAGIKLNYMF
jgi:hypothetical protein